MWKPLTVFPSLLSIECKTIIIIQELYQSRQLLKTYQLFGKFIHTVIFLCFFSFLFTPEDIFSLLLKREEETLTGVAQWIKLGPVNQRVAGLIPSQGTCLGCGPGPQ